VGYRGKVVEQERARELRALGWTLGEICEELAVSKASASLWCRDVIIDEAALVARRRERAQSGRRAAQQRGPNKLQRAKQDEIEAGRRWGARAIGDLSARDLLIAGTALYAGEGSKTDGCVKFANTDPRMIRLFMTWLRTTFDVDERRLRLRLYLHDGLDLASAEAHWSAVTSIPLAQFTSPYRAVPDPSIRRSKHPMGCVSVVYGCSRTHREVMGLVAALLSSDSPSGGSVPLGNTALPG
jgi:hypothetical protein